MPFGWRKASDHCWLRGVQNLRLDVVRFLQLSSLEW